MTVAARPGHLSSPEAMLAWLGEAPDADGVADKLRSLGVRGRKGSARDCPIAIALVMAGATSVSAGTWDVGWARNAGNADYPWHPLPPVVRQFVAVFDRGRYPDLAE